MKFYLGCNYWDSASGTDMWKNFDEDIVRQDIKALSENGIKYMRVFPNWREFQPVQQLYKWRMGKKECRTIDDEPLADDTGVDKKQLENFRKFARICDEYGVQLIVAIVTGWMSGRQFVPPVLNGRNLLNDPEALMWTERFIRGFVSGVKDLPNILIWDLGNECNCLSSVNSRAEAYTWTAFVRNAIRAVDPDRPIGSGMHGLDDTEDGTWLISDQGELTDYLTPHPYISPTIHNDYDAPNQMRSTIFPTAQSMYYRDLGGKPVILEEQNCFTDTTANKEEAANFARVNVYSCIAHGIEGYFWWCGTEHKKLNQPPYSWSMMERSLGLIDDERNPKPVCTELSKVEKVISGLPFESLPEAKTDAVCVLTQNERWSNASISFVLAKQAGLNLKFYDGNISGKYPPDAPLYIVPGVHKWEIMCKHAWESIKDKVYNNGANMLVTYDGGSLIELEEVFGFRAHGNIRTKANHKAEFEFGELEYHVEQELMLESTGAKVLSTNEAGNIVFSEHQYGKGKVYFLNMPLEKNLFDVAGAFNDTDWYKIYRTVAAEIINNKTVVSENPQIGVTVHDLSEDKAVVCAVNYSDKEQNTCLKVKENWVLTEIHGSLNRIDKCSGAFYYACKNVKRD